MDPALAVIALGGAAEKLGAVLAVTAAGIALVDRDPRRRALAVVCALSVAAVVLVGHIWHNPQFRSISDDAAKFTVLLVLAACAVGVLALLFHARPALLPLLAAAALPFRVPIASGGSTANLLVPLYFVLGGGAVAYAWKQFRLSERSAAGRRAGSLGLAIAAFIVLYGLQSLYSNDFSTALEQMVFFYVPFAILFTLLVEVRWSRSLLIGCAAIVVLEALAFSGIGFWEYHRRELLWNPKVIGSNQFESYFRVNSVFWDPNIYGRFLALVMVTIAGMMLWSRRQGTALAAAVLLGVLWGGLVLTFSQSSFAALLAGLAVLAALRWDPRRTAAATAIGLGLAALFVLAFQSTLKVHLGSSSGLNKVTSGRVNLIEGGLDLFRSRPLWGHGSGSFARSYRLARKGNQQEAVSASHTMPITIAAEQGLVGLVAYMLLLLAAFVLLLGRSAISVHGPRGPPEERGGGLPLGDLAAYSVARAVLTAAFAALVVHTMMYAAFLEDPFTWVILAMGVAVAPYARLAEEPGRVPARASAPTLAEAC
jgi:hypothetical protein